MNGLALTNRGSNLDLLQRNLDLLTKIDMFFKFVQRKSHKKKKGDFNSKTFQITLEKNDPKFTIGLVRNLDLLT